MDKFQNKYRIPSTRLPNWDYSQAGLYFITICTQNRLQYFGKIKNGIMNPSEIGKIVEREWLKTFDMRPDMNLWMGEFVVMPNHFHAIIGIGENQYNAQCKDPMHCVSTKTNHFAPQSKNLASIVRGFKSSVTFTARKIIEDFSWQTRFYEHIIRNNKSFQKISDYIINNPANWQEDKWFDL